MKLQKPYFILRMKKLISMLAFVAAIAISTFCLASCTNDDDEGGRSTNRYTFEFKFETKNPEVAKDPECQKRMRDTEKEVLKGLSSEYRFTDAKAMSEWMKIGGSQKYISDMQDLLDEMARIMGDTTLSCKITMKKNGTEWHYKEWTTMYHGY